MSKQQSKFRKRNVKREQPKKDSRSKRINMDNERVSKFEKDLEKEFKRKDSNDIRWYSKSPAMLTASARIPFATIAGVTPVTDKGVTEPAIASAGVMQIKYAPNFVSNRPVINQAFNGMYSDIVHANSRNYTYDMPDLAIMVTAGMEIFSAIGLGLRAYGLMKQFKEESMYTPRALVEAAGFNYLDLKRNYGTMWEDLLFLIAQSRQIWIPNTMPIIERRFWMNTQVYADADNVKPQYYMYTPTALYKYEGYTDTKGGKLTTVEGWGAPDANRGWVFAGSVHWDKYIEIVQSMIDALIPDQDRGIMYGDILKAYGKENLFAINEIDWQYITPITYSKEVLWQIENLTAGGNSMPVELLQSTDGQIYQRWTGMKSKDTSGNFSKYVYPETPILNFHQNEAPTPEQLAVATRMTSAGRVEYARSTYNTTDKKWEQSTTEKVVIPTATGTEIVIGTKFFYNEVTQNGAVNPSTYSPELVGLTNLDAKTVMFISQFDWHPCVYVYYNYTAGVTNLSDFKVQYVVYDLENWTKISSQDLAQIHNAIVYSLYNIPTL